MHPVVRPAVGLGLGVGLMIVAAIAWAIYGLAQKRLLTVFTSRRALGPWSRRSLQA